MACTNIDENFELIEEPKLKLSDLINWYGGSALKEVCVIEFPDPANEPTTEDIRNICTKLVRLLEGDLTYEMLTAIYVASSITYLMSSNFKDFECRTDLLHRTFRYTDTLDPVNLHIAAKRLHTSIKSPIHLLTITKNLCFISDMANALAMCLAWAMLLEILNHEIEMYCFHLFSDLKDLLVEIDISEMLKEKESSLKASFLLELVAILLTNIISKPNDVFKNAGYSQYFRYDLEDIQALRDWAKTANERITVSIENSNTCYDLTMTIKETMAFSIISPLDEKLKMMDGGRDHFGLTY